MMGGCGCGNQYGELSDELNKAYEELARFAGENEKLKKVLIASVHPDDVAKIEKVIGIRLER